MSLGNGVLKGRFYTFPVLKGEFFIKYSDEKYYVLRKDYSGILLVLSSKNSLQQAKEYLVKYINEKRFVSFPNLTL